MKALVVAELENHSLSEDNLIKVKKKMIESNIKLLILFSILLIITIVGMPRIIIFIRILGNNFFALQIVGISFYFISLFLIFIYYLYIVFYIFKNKNNNDEWVYKIYKFKKKTDLVSFTCRCISIFLFILIFLVNPCTVEGASMNDTFMENDKVICVNVFYYPKRNDVIVFDAERYTKQKNLYIKRVVAVEGDLLEYKSNILYINGEKEELQRVDPLNFYRIESGIKKYGGIQTEKGIAVPKGMVVVLGDNRENSNDSGEYGPIFISDIYGKVVIRIFPFDKIRLF